MGGRTPYLGPRIDAGAPEKDVRRMFRKHVGKKFAYQMSKGYELDKRQRRGYRRRRLRRDQRASESGGGAR